MKKILSIFMAVALTVGVVGCSGGGSSADAELTEIKIGLVCPISGQSAIAGEYITNGVSLIMDQLEKDGGLEVNGKKVPVKLIIEDNEAQPEKTTTVYRKLIDQDKVVAIVGPDMSKAILAAGPIAQQAKIPAIGTFTTNIKVTEVGDFIFRACFIDPFQGEVAANYAIQKHGAKTAAILYNNGDDYAKGLMESFTKTFEEGGGKVIELQSYSGPDIKDYNVQLAKIKAANADVFFLPNLFGELPLQVKQAKEMGITTPIVGGDSFDTPDIPNLAGVDTVEDIAFVSAFSPDDPSPAAKAFVEQYNAKFNTNPNSNATLAYEGLSIVLKAIQDAGSTDGQAIRDAMANISGLELPSGKIKFDENRNPIKGAVMMVYKNGVPVFDEAIAAE